MKLETPQILWNSEIDDNKGRNAPLYSIDVVESGSDGGHVLVTAGNTTDVNLWNVQGTKISHMITLTRHERPVNAVAFSPDGLHLATAGETGNIVMWSVPVQKRGNGNGRHHWSLVSSEADLSVRIVNTHNCNGVCDLAWSADSKRFVAGGTTDRCILVYEDANHSTNHPSLCGDHKDAEAKEGGDGSTAVPKPSGDNVKRQMSHVAASQDPQKESDWKLVFNSVDHTQFVQGVAYDPLNMYVASMSSDRTIRVYPRKFAKSKTRKLLAKGDGKASRDILTGSRLEFGKSKSIKHRKVGVVESDKQECDRATDSSFVRQKLFCDESTCESFFRRLSWTSDGAFLVAPAALWHIPGSPPIFATYLFARHRFDEPCRVLPGLDKPSVVVRSNPVLFKLPNGATTSPDKHALPYRSIFCVLTLDSILVYDTVHTQPLAMLQGLHYANLTDCAWSRDGLTLWVCSTDGYVSIVRFGKGELGEVYEMPVEAETPIESIDADSTNPLDESKNGNPSDSSAMYNNTNKWVEAPSETDVNSQTTTITPRKKRRIQPVLVSVD